MGPPGCYTASMRLSTILAALLTSSTIALAGAPNSQQAAAFEAKMNAIITRGESRPTGYRTEFVGDEVNSYLQLRLAAKLPTGVADPAVTLQDAGRLSGRAIVDLDGIRKKSSGGWFDPTAYLGGKLPVTATGTLTTANGTGQFSLETAEISGIPIPKSFLQELVSYYTKSPDNPNGINIDAPFQLPVQIQRIDVVTDKATVVQ
jgi:hypothetical protein